MATSDGSASSFDGNSGKEGNVEIERLYRKFTFKCLQIIVQSRIECKNEFSSGKDQYADLFSITLPDDPSIEDQIKKVLDGLKPFPIKDQSVCIEIPLVTNDGDHMFLETWDISVNLSSLDMSANKTQHIYTRMGVTLKSLLCATRATPAYRLAKNQGEKGGGYKLSYRLYVGKPQTHLLGEGFKTCRAGSLPSANGLLTINVAFRTRLLISPEMSTSSMKAIEVTDNYFLKEIATKPAAISPACSKPQPCSPHRSPENRPCSPYCFAVSPTSAEQEEDLIRARLTADADHWSHSGIFSMDEIPEPVSGAFSKKQSGNKFVQQDMPFEGLMKRSLLARQSRQLGTCQGVNGGSDVDGALGNNASAAVKKSGKALVEEEKENVPARGKNVQCEQKMSVEEDFIMIDRAPFAADEDPKDVKTFLGLIFQAPNMFEAQDLRVSVDEYLTDVGALVTKSEEDMPELDEFCQSVINLNSREEDEVGDDTFFS